MTIIRLRNPNASRVVPIEWKSSGHKTPQLQTTLSRIEANYDKLDTLLNQLEQRIHADAKLSEIDQSLAETSKNHEIELENSKRRVAKVSKNTLANHRIVRKPR